MPAHARGHEEQDDALIWLIHCINALMMVRAHRLGVTEHRDVIAADGENPTQSDARAAQVQVHRSYFYEAIQDQQFGALALNASSAADLLWRVISSWLAPRLYIHSLRFSQWYLLSYAELFLDNYRQRVDAQPVALRHLPAPRQSPIDTQAVAEGAYEVTQDEWVTEEPVPPTSAYDWWDITDASLHDVLRHGWYYTSGTYTYDLGQIDDEPQNPSGYIFQNLAPGFDDESERYGPCGSYTLG